MKVKFYVFFHKLELNKMLLYGNALILILLLIFFIILYHNILYDKMLTRENKT